MYPCKEKQRNLDQKQNKKLRDNIFDKIDARNPFYVQTN